VPGGAYLTSQHFSPTVNGQAIQTDSGDPTGYADASAYMMVDLGVSTDPTAVTLQSFLATGVVELVSIVLMAGLLTLAGLVAAGAAWMVQRRRTI